MNRSVFLSLLCICRGWKGRLPLGDRFPPPTAQLQTYSIFPLNKTGPILYRSDKCWLTGAVEVDEVRSGVESDWRCVSILRLPAVVRTSTRAAVFQKPTLAIRLVNQIRPRASSPFSKTIICTTLPSLLTTKGNRYSG